MRIKIEFPAQNPLGTFVIPVRIGDLNYGGHVGNDAVLSILHEARMQLLATAGFTELDAGGQGLIMTDSTIVYRGESFYGDVLRVQVYANDLTAKAFDLLYHVSTVRNGIDVLIAEAKTGLLCFDYSQRKIAPMPDKLRQFLSAFGS